MHINGSNIKLRFFCHFLRLNILLFSINVHSQLVSDFTTINSNTGCGSLLVEFEDLSTGNPDTWFWDFGNGQTSSLENPLTQTYNQAGDFPVFFEAYNNLDTTDLYTLTSVTIVGHN